MARCNICSVKHSRFRDAAHLKPASYCHSCHASHMRRTRPKYCELPLEVRKKSIARAFANVYQQRGKLSPMPCELCGTHESEKHHDDYSAPLDVRWVCRPCHLSIHRNDLGTTHHVEHSHG